jgi:putative AlgH/UPF0301 family transcriptional regulator
LRIRFGSYTDIYAVNTFVMTSNKKYPGYLLVANPNNPRDELGKSVMLIVSHTDKLSIALQVNNPVEDVNLQTIAYNIGLESYPREDLVYFGGNIAQNKIHVIHSNDWKGMSTTKLNDQISVTNDVSVLAALSRNEGPEHFRACAGYWLWDNGMLDDMLDPRDRTYPHKWEITPATVDGIFDGEGPEQWRAAVDNAAKYQVNAWF